MNDWNIFGLSRDYHVPYPIMLNYGGVCALLYHAKLGWCVCLTLCVPKQKYVSDVMDIMVSQCHD